MALGPLYTKSGGGGTLPVGLGQAAGGIFFIVDDLDTKAKGYDHHCVEVR